MTFHESEKPVSITRNTRVALLLPITVVWAHIPLLPRGRQSQGYQSWYSERLLQTTWLYTWKLAIAVFHVTPLGLWYGLWHRHSTAQWLFCFLTDHAVFPVRPLKYASINCHLISKILCCVQRVCIQVLEYRFLSQTVHVGKLGKVLYSMRTCCNGHHNFEHYNGCNVYLNILTPQTL